MSRRKAAADELAVLARGGLPALEAAERLLGRAARAEKNLNIRIAGQRLDAYREAAETAKQSLTDWVTSHLDAAARRQR